MSRHSFLLCPFGRLTRLQNDLLCRFEIVTSIICHHNIITMKLTCFWSLLLLVETVLSLTTTTSWTVPTKGLSGKIWNDRAKPEQTPSPLNATLPLVLTVVAPDQFPSLSKARKAIRQQKILIDSSDNGIATNTETSTIVGKSDTRIHPGDVIRIKDQLPPTAITVVGYPDLSYSKPSGAILPKIIYEDDDVAIINKLSGMICHSIDKGGYDTNSVLRVAPLILTPPDASIILDGLEWPALVHRLDTKTSGLLLLSKTRTATLSLCEQFETRKVSKTYQAIVEGRPDCDDAEEGTGRIESMVDDKVAVTFYKILKTMPTAKGIPLTWIEFSPITGRRHQLRQHASFVLKCPIVGDTLYGSSWSNLYMYLCATRISCQHPRWSPMLLEAEIPAPGRFDKFWQRESGRYAGHQKWLQLQCGASGNGAEQESND
jgi:23S rRNA-/tRNA-specific pseudouridylate synthase